MAKSPLSSDFEHGDVRFTPTLQGLGLAKNEARIYETLIRYGELSVGQIAAKSHVHRRNVYDSINKLVERGLVFEIVERRENRYQAVEPNKLRELIHERELGLTAILPGLEALYSQGARSQAVYIYRGVEGWKNYMRDILRLGEDFYCIGAKGGWMDKRVMKLFPSFIKEAERKKIRYFHLFDHEVQSSGHDIVKYVGKDFKFLPEGYSAPASLDIFGNRVNIVSNIHLGGVEEDMWFAVVVNQRIADAFRIWFKLIWDLCPQNTQIAAQTLSGRIPRK
jgi:sugar-specific transcriptional regulator TrmB